VGEVEAGRRLTGAIYSAIKEGRKTRDIGGELGTRAFTTEVANRMRA
jgi:isocitrate/isopropylmalate dehydrogenase